MEIKKISWPVFIIIFAVVAVFTGKIIYDKIYEDQLEKTLNDMGLDEDEIDAIKGMDIEGLTKEEIIRKIVEKEIEEMLNEMGVSMDEIDISGMDFSGLSREEIYDLIYDKVLALSGSEELPSGPETGGETSSFVCENDDSVGSRGYVYLHGLGDHNPAAVNFLKDLIQNDSKTKGILDFDYSEQLTLDEISNDFVSEFNAFKSQHDLEEIVIIGQSAGGVIGAYSVHKLNFDGDMELHTLASPLNGYGDFGAAAEQMAQSMTGFAKEIGLGFDPFITPQNIKVYHHKTSEDEDLRSWCGSYAALCSPKTVQDNNIEGSKEFYYPDYNHTTIVSAVSEMIVNCRQ